MNKKSNRKTSIYILSAFVSIIFFYISINILYTQTSSAYYDEALINDLPNAEKFVTKINASVSDANGNIVSIQWEGINDNNLVYYVYRSTSPIIGKSSLIDSKVVDYIKASNTSKIYTILDRPIITSKYYYAVVSYMGDLVFYNGEENIDTLSVLFEGISDNKGSSYYNINTNNTENAYNNNLKYATNFILVTNTYFVTNIYTVTNTINNNNANYNRHKSEYNRALAEFKRGNYLQTYSILSPLSGNNVNKNLYYDINLLLAKCCKYLGRKKDALDALNRIKNYNSKEVNFWINQVLSDL